MNKEEAFSQINLNVRILEEESCKISQKLDLEQPIDLDASHCCISGWIVDTKESPNKSSTITRFPQTRERDSNRGYTSSQKSNSLLKTQVQESRPESEFLYFENSSDYIQFYRKEKFKRLEFSLRQPFTKVKKHEKQTLKNTFSSGKSDRRGDKLKNLSGVHGNINDPSFRASRQRDGENNPLMLVITSKGYGEKPNSRKASNLPLTGYFSARRLQLRPPNIKTKIQSNLSHNYTKQNCTKVDTKSSLGSAVCSQAKYRNPVTILEQKKVKSSASKANKECQRQVQVVHSRTPKECCNSSKGGGENSRELSHAVKHMEINSHMTCTGKSHFKKPTPPRSKPSISPSRIHRSCSVPQLQVCTTSLQGSHLGTVATDVSCKGVTTHRQGQTTPSVDYSQYMQMFKNVLDYYGQKKLQQKPNESQLQLQNLLSLRS